MCYCGCLSWYFSFFTFCCFLLFCLFVFLLSQLLLFLFFLSFFPSFFLLILPFYFFLSFPFLQPRASGETRVISCQLKKWDAFHHCSNGTPTLNRTWPLHWNGPTGILSCKKLLMLWISSHASPYKKNKRQCQVHKYNKPINNNPRTGQRGHSIRQSGYVYIYIYIGFKLCFVFS